MDNKVYAIPNVQTPSTPVRIDPEKCIGCNMCTKRCRTQTIMPNPEKGKPPIVIYPDECWFCGCCVEDCPTGALTLVPPAKQLISTVWKRKATGEEFRIGMKNPPAPNTTPPSGRY